MDKSILLPLDCNYSESARCGLLNYNDNSFYLLDFEGNVDILKKIQFILMRYECFLFVELSKHFSYFDQLEKQLDQTHNKVMEEFIKYTINHIELSLPKNYRQEKEIIQKRINNNNCFLYGLSTPSLANPYSLDLKHGVFSFYIIKKEKKSIAFNNELQEKIYFLHSILSMFNTYSGHFRFMYDYNTTNLIYGIDQLSEFLKLTNQSSADLNDLLQNESNNLKTENTALLTHIERDLMIILNNLNYSESLDEIATEFDNQITNNFLNETNSSQMRAHLRGLLKQFLKKLL